MKKTIGEYIFDRFNIILMILFCIITVYPVYYVIIASISAPNDIISHTGMLLYPKSLDFVSYKLVFEYPMIFTSYGNTIIYVVFGTLLNILLTTFGGYGLSRKGVPGSKFIMLAITITMFFSGGLIPRYLLVQNLNLIDTMWAVLLPSAIGTTNLIIMRTSFKNVPAAMEESAKIDGANDFTILFKIMIPMSMATISVLILFYAVNHWNEFFNPMLYLKSRDKFPLQLLLRELLITNSTDSMMGDVDEKSSVAQVIKYSTIVVSTVPILCVYPFLQRYFTKGVMIGAVKG
mgnify:CR=1 FL=1